MVEDLVYYSTVSRIKGFSISMYNHNVKTDIMEGSMPGCVSIGYVCNYKSDSGNLNIL